MNSEKEINNLKQQIISAGLQLLQQGLVSRTFGNVSIRIDDTYMLITPSGRKYDDLQAEDIIKLNFHNYEYEGIVKPSSELKLHAEIYKVRKEINAVIHTHQQNASTLAAAHHELPPIIDDQAQMIGPGVRLAEYAASSSTKLVRNVVEALYGRMAALMANHGAICIGRNIEEAFVVSQVLEKAAKAFIEASFIGGAKPIPNSEAIELHKEYLEKYSKEENRNKNTGE
ncbi:MAG: class II aldolase family protein [Marinilabiliales bacterium]|nr:MAG: class II aldolase family protein [Marinilabiliales bacterium]